MNLLIPGAVVSLLRDPRPDAPPPIVDEPYLILAADARLDQLVMIPTTVRHSANRYRYLGVKTFSYAEIESQINLENPSLSIHSFTPRQVSAWTDQELADRFHRRRGAEPPQVRKLKLRWAMIEPLVNGDDRNLLFETERRRARIEKRAEEILADDSMVEILTSVVRVSKAKRGKAYDTSRKSCLRRLEAEIQRLLNQYWAGGSVRGALIGFEHACGAPGKPKKLVSKKIGRKNAAVLEGYHDRAGICIAADSRDARIIKHCYDTWVIRHTTVSSAARRMWDEFYSDEVQQPDGSMKRVLVPAEHRPTEAQFRYWGTLEDRSACAWKRHLPPKEFEKSFRAVLGSVNDDVYAVGQRGGIDSSPPDIQLVRAIDRLKRVGGGHRVLVADSIVGYIPGVYMGFDAPSARTVRLAIFNAMDPDKRLWLEDLCLDDELDADDFIPMWFESLWADNTDLRNEEIKQCLTGIGTDVNFIPVMRGDLNSRAETSHKQLHRMVDHNLLGSSYGKKTDRGESSATERARLTMMEAMREVVRAIHLHNTCEFDDIRPLRMRQKNVPCTRFHITRELMRTGHVARALQAVDLSRRFLLPRLDGTFTESGVRLHRSNESEKVEFIGHISYVSSHPLIVKICEDARRGGKSDAGYFRRTFIVNPYRPRRIWYVDLGSAEAIELHIKVLKLRDPDLPFELTLPEMLTRDGKEAEERLTSKDSRDRKVIAVEVKQREAGAKAVEAYQASIVQHGPLTKAEMKRDKRENREAERADCVFGVPIPERVMQDSSSSQPIHSKTGDSAQSQTEEQQGASGNSTSKESGATADKQTSPVRRRPRKSMLAMWTSQDDPFRKT